MCWTSKQPWTTYAVFLSSFNPPAAIMDPLLGYMLYRVFEDSQKHSIIPSMSVSGVLFFCWVIFTKTVKFIGHFRRYPADLKFLPILYVFSYLHGFIYLYSLVTLHRVRHFSSFDETAMADRSNRLDGMEVVLA